MEQLLKDIKDAKVELKQARKHANKTRKQLTSEDLETLEKAL